MEIKINQNTSNYIECDNCKYYGKTYCYKYNEDLFYNDNSSTPCDTCLKELKTYIDSITN